MTDKKLKILLDSLHFKYRKRFSSKDPVWILHELQSAGNRENDLEILGLIVSCYSYGNVDQINSFINRFLKQTGSKIFEFTSNFSEQKDKKYLKDLYYRFNTGKDFINLVKNIKKAINDHGSLKELFRSNLKEEDVNVLPALSAFSKELNKIKSGDLYYRYLIPDPESGSTCKRLNLFLRWMVRKDEIDTGAWNSEIPASKLIMPVDTHVYRITRKLKMVKRKTYDMKYAVELTEKLKKFDPDDPVKYDFALCHVGVDKIENVC